MTYVCYNCGYPTPGEHAPVCPDAGSGVIEAYKPVAPREVAKANALVVSLVAQLESLKAAQQMLSAQFATSQSVVRRQEDIIALAQRWHAAVDAVCELGLPAVEDMDRAAHALYMAIEHYDP